MELHDNPNSNPSGDVTVHLDNDFGRPSVGNRDSRVSIDAHPEDVLRAMLRTPPVTPADGQ